MLAESSPWKLYLEAPRSPVLPLPDQTGPKQCGEGAIFPIIGLHVHTMPYRANNIPMTISDQENSMGRTPPPPTCCSPPAADTVATGNSQLPHNCQSLLWSHVKCSLAPSPYFPRIHPKLLLWHCFGLAGNRRCSKNGILCIEEIVLVL